MSEVSFTVPGEPKGKGRPRFDRRGFAYTPTETRNKENEIRFEYIRQCNGYRFPDDAELDLTVTAYYGVPKSDSRKKREDKLSGRIRPTKKPDMDNVVKIVADALNDVAYRDDTMIVDCEVRKFYVEHDSAKMEIELKDVRKDRD